VKVIGIEAIKKALGRVNLMLAIEDGFVAYSQGEAVVPPIADLRFDKPPGEVHIKYGYLKNDDYYVVKIASGFYENSKAGLPSSNGLMLLFSQRTGEPLVLLQDNGLLTDVRTAVAGAIAAKYLAPKAVSRIGILGTGTQARLQLRYLKSLTPCREVLVWGRSELGLERYLKDMTEDDFSLRVALAPRELAETCNLIVTTTPSREPLLFAKDIRPGTHISAIGSDAPGKQELEPAILQKAQRLVVDSLSQCKERGEMAHALRQGLVAEASAVELGHIITGERKGRTAEDQITVADLTGIAVQDIQIAKAVYEALM
jgi:ornithine cyclodeaminase